MSNTSTNAELFNDRLTPLMETSRERMTTIGEATYISDKAANEMIEGERDRVARVVGIAEGADAVLSGAVEHTKPTVMRPGAVVEGDGTKDVENLPAHHIAADEAAAAQLVGEAGSSTKKSGEITVEEARRALDEIYGLAA